MNKDLLGKARAAKSAEELRAMAKANNIELTEAEAAEHFSQLHQSGELSDEELSAVSGGGCHAKDGRLVITTGYQGDLALESASFEQKAAFFEEIFGIRPVLKQKRRV